jgi:signal transduction histidine kinase
VLGIIFFGLIITGLILNTIFLLREIRRNEQHDAFLNAVTHELKTPIASIKLYLETLRSRELDPQKQKEFYDIMLSDTNRLMGTVDQVLQASRTKEKHRSMNPSEFELVGLIEETVETVRTRNNLGEGAIRITEPSETIKIVGDRTELQTAFTNLLENAVRYSDGDPKISIRVKNTTPNRAEVFIRDSGIGIAPGDLKRVFKRFYRVPNPTTQAKKGTGLGLSIVKAIVEKHGGKIRAQSGGLGKGTTFWVQLPKS